MLGHTHCAFGVATATPLVALTGIGLGAIGRYDRFTYPLAGSRVLSVPHLSPAVWIALVVAAGLGSLLPDIDQPGSLVTRLPANQTRALQRARAGVGRAPGSGPARATLAAADAGGRLVTALLGGYAGRLDRAFTLLLWLLTLLAGAEAAAARWLPPDSLLSLSVQWRHACALALGLLAISAGLVAAGGGSGLVNRLPGHHRGWTHAPPAAIALCLLSLALGPALVPALPGIGAAFGFGYISHLVADSLTIRGIPLWWPGETQPSLHLLPRHVRVRTGSAGEALFNVCWPVLVIAIVIVAGR